MTTKAFNEKYGEPVDCVEEDEVDTRHECTFCGELYDSDQLTTVKSGEHNNRACIGCMAEIGETVREALKC